MKRSQFSIALYMLAVFLSGSMVGAFAHRLYMVRTVSTASDPLGQRRSPSEYRQRYLNEMKMRLGLDETQTSRMNEILERTRLRFREFNEKHKTEMSDIHQEQVQEIRAILKDDQQQRYQTYLHEREHRRKDFGR